MGFDYGADVVLGGEFGELRLALLLRERRRLARTIVAAAVIDDVEHDPGAVAKAGGGGDGGGEMGHRGLDVFWGALSRW